MATEPEPPTSPADDAPTVPEPEVAPSPAASETPPKAELVHPGSLALAVLAALLTFLIVAQNGQFRWSVPVGVLLLLSGIGALFDALGTFDETDQSGEPGGLLPTVPVSRVARALGLLAIAGVGFGAALVLGQYGYVPGIFAGALVFLTYVAILATVFGTARALGVFDDPAPLHKHYGFWLLVLAGALYFPSMGLFSLSDPWETHYGEGRPRDPRPRRLDLAVVGPRRLVLVEADPELLDPGARNECTLHALPARPDADRQGRPAGCPPGVGGARPQRTPHLAGDVRDLPRGRQGVRQARRVPGRLRARHLPGLVFPGPTRP